MDKVLTLPTGDLVDTFTAADISFSKDNRIAQALKFLNLLFGNVEGKHFGYLWTKPSKETISFDVSTQDTRAKMARKAIDLNDRGEDVYFGVNLVDAELPSNQRAKNETVTVLTATIADIDVANDKAHKGDKDHFPPTFDAAKKLLPFDASIVVNSGYGLHAYYLYTPTITITDDNRDEAIKRNKRFIAEIKRRAEKHNISKGADGIGDLPRILRLPGTFNYKDANNPVLCHVVDVNDIRFTPADMDEKLNAFEPTNGINLIDHGYHEVSINYQNTRDKPSDQERAIAMLEFIPVVNLSYDEWLNVGIALKNTGNSVSDWEQWSKADDRFKQGECESKWKGFVRNGLTIATIHDLAQKHGYSEKDFQRDWYQLHPDKKPSARKTIDNNLKRELDEAIIWLDTLTPDEFTADDATNSQNIRAVALAKIFGYSTQSEKFFYVIKDARKNAKIRLADAKSNLTEPLSDQEKKSLQALIDLNINRLNYLIKIQVDTIKIQLADFRQQEHKRKVEFAKAKREEEVSQNLSSLNDLIKTYRANPTRELANKIRKIVFNACEPRCDKYGYFLGIKSTAANAKIIFSYDPVIDGLIGYDEFKQADVFLKVAPWKYEHGTPLDKQPCIRQEWRDSDDAELRKYLRETYTEFTGKQLISDYTTSYSNKNRFHVVKEFFKNLPLWDGTPRAETLFIKFLRVDDSPFAREVTLNWLTAAVARIFHPGCRYQTALVLHGAQGIGKGYTLEQLGGEWYGALVDNVDDPHAIDTIKSLWIVEIPEMSAMRKAEVNAIKSFISRSEDTRRFAYERRAARVQRHCVFAITVNDDQFLIDPTGNRRYLILHCNSNRLDYVEGLTDEYIKQVWAEVYFKYNKLFKDGFDEKKLELSKSAQFQAEEIASRYMKDDGLQGEIQAFVDTKIPPLPIWNLLSREERRKFFAQGFITLLDGQDDLSERARGRFGRNAQKYVNELYEIFKRQDTFIRKTRVKRGDGTLEEFHIYGSEYRQHICAAEIFTECFGQDNRKKIHRVHEILAELDGWSQGDRIPRDMAYGNQPNVFYRNTAKKSSE